jgi:hypothetical protein
MVKAYGVFYDGIVLFEIWGFSIARRERRELLVFPFGA